jgi:hypothetical protein
MVVKAPVESGPNRRPEARERHWIVNVSVEREREREQEVCRIDCESAVLSTTSNGPHPMESKKGNDVASSPVGARSVQEHEQVEQEQEREPARELFSV